jgi:Rieske Fe-S protein
VTAPAVQVAVEDAQGNTVTSSTARVTLAISSGTGTAGAVLGGTRSRTAVAGIARFNDLTIDKAGTGYTLTATATSLGGATSTAFDVDPWLGIPTFIDLQSDAGDYIGGGLTYQYTQADAIVTVVVSGDCGLPRA